MDVLDFLEEKGTAFETQKANENTPRNNYDKSNYNTGYVRSGSKPKQLSARTDIKPVKIEIENMIPKKKTFAISIHNIRDGVPEAFAEKIVTIAKVLFSKGYTLRCDGDKNNAVLNKVIALQDSKLECYLPWRKFNEEFQEPTNVEPIEKAYGMMASVHSKFFELKQGLRAILANNIHVLLGKECNEPLDILIVYNLDGSEVVDKKTEYKKQGNTTTPIRIAGAVNTNVFNVNNETALSRLNTHLKQ